MRKLGNIFTVIALTISLGLILVLHYHIIEAGRGNIFGILFVAIILSGAGSLLRIKSRKYIVGKKTGLQKVAHTIIYSSLGICIFGAILVICHIRDMGIGLMGGSTVVGACGFSILMFGVVTSLIKSKVIFNSAFYRSSLIINILLYLCFVFLFAWSFLKIFHYSRSNFLLFAGAILFVILFIYTSYFLAMTKKKYTVSDLNIIEITSDELGRYIGVYHNQQMKIAITVTKKDIGATYMAQDAGATLMAQAVGLPAYPLIATEKNVFNFKRGGIVIEFKPAENEFILTQGNRYFSFIKQ